MDPSVRQQLHANITITHIPENTFFSAYKRWVEIYCPLKTYYCAYLIKYYLPPPQVYKQSPHLLTAKTKRMVIIPGDMT